MVIKINKPKWDSEGLPDMIFTADYMNTVYECCHNDCENCTLGKPILNDSTTACLIITEAKLKLTKQIKDQL